MEARRRQEKRFQGSTYLFNSQIEARALEYYCPLGEEEKDYMEKIFYSLKLSARGYHRVLKVARTIADLEGEENIKKKHLSEAVCYRAPEI